MKGNKRNNKNTKKVFLQVLVFVLFIVSAGWLIFYDEGLPENPSVRVVFLDVGQGSAVYIETPSGKDYLVDVGPDSRILHELSNVMPFHDKVIDGVFLTHPDEDHLGGIIDLIDYYDVKMVFDNGLESDTKTYDTYVSELESKGIERRSAMSESVYVLDDRYNVYLRRLSPVKPGEYDEENDNSLVFLLEFGDFDVLLTGDAGEVVEKNLVGRGGIDSGDIEVLQVAHHGSRFSTSREFVDFIGPEVAVIQAGVDNRYGHPSKDVLDVLEEKGVKVLCTCSTGKSIEIRSDGEGYFVEGVDSL